MVRMLSAAAAAQTEQTDQIYFPSVFIPTATPQLSHLGPAEPPITHDLALQVWINTLVSVQGMFALCRPHICSYFTVTSNNYYCTVIL